jgi:hypothetical protein
LISRSADALPRDHRLDRLCTCREIIAAQRTAKIS